MNSYKTNLRNFHKESRFSIPFNNTSIKRRILVNKLGLSQETDFVDTTTSHLTSNGSKNLYLKGYNRNINNHRYNTISSSSSSLLSPYDFDDNLTVCNESSLTLCSSRLGLRSPPPEFDESYLALSPILQKEDISPLMKPLDYQYENDDDNDETINFTEDATLFENNDNHNLIDDKSYFFRKSHHSNNIRKAKSLDIINITSADLKQLKNFNKKNSNILKKVKESEESEEIDDNNNINNEDTVTKISNNLIKNENKDENENKNHLNIIIEEESYQLENTVDLKNNSINDKSNDIENTIDNTNNNNISKELSVTNNTIEKGHITEEINSEKVNVSKDILIEKNNDDNYDKNASGNIINHFENLCHQYMEPESNASTEDESNEDEFINDEFDEDNKETSVSVLQQKSKPGEQLNQLQIPQLQRLSQPSFQSQLPQIKILSPSQSYSFSSENSIKSNNNNDNDNDTNTSTNNTNNTNNINDDTNINTNNININDDTNTSTDNTNNINNDINVNNNTNKISINSNNSNNLNSTSINSAKRFVSPSLSSSPNLINSNNQFMLPSSSPYSAEQIFLQFVAFDEQEKSILQQALINQTTQRINEQEKEACRLTNKINQQKEKLERHIAYHHKLSRELDLKRHESAELRQKLSSQLEKNQLQQQKINYYKEMNNKFIEENRILQQRIRELINLKFSNKL